MAHRRWRALRPFVLLAAVGGVVGTARAASPNPFEGELDQAVVQLRARRGQPEAVAPLAAALRLADRVPPAALEAVVKQVAMDAQSDPLVAAQAAFELAAFEEGRGDEAAAQTRRRALGLVDEAWVVGPFDSQGREALARVHPPEVGTPDPRRGGPYAGKEREVSWRRATGVARDGALLLDALVRPDRDAVAYVLFWLKSERPRSVALRLGSPGPIKVWVGGQVVLERDVLRPARFDQDAAGVQLSAGDNLVLVKTVVTDGAWRLLVRATEPDGRTLTRVTVSADPPPRKAARAGRGRAPVVRELASLLRARAEHAPAGQTRADAWEDVAWFLALAEPDDSEAEAGERALDQAEAAAGGARLATALLRAEIARSDDDRRAALERAVGLAARGWPRARVLSLLGERARAGRRDSVAFESWRQALAEDAACWPATLSLADEEIAAGLVGSAWARLVALPAALDSVPRVLRARARALERLGRPREAEAQWSQLLSTHAQEIDLIQTLAAAARVRGATSLQTALLRRAAVARPDLPHLTIELARTLEGAGEGSLARTLLTGAVARLPDEPALAEEFGRFCARQAARHGDDVQLRNEALSWLRRALLLRPQNPALRRFTEQLASAGTGVGLDGAADLARRHAEDADPVARKALAAAPPAGSADAARVLLDRRVVEVHDNGLSEVFAQRIVQVVTERGARDNKQFYVRYTPGDQEVEIRKARLFRLGPTGEVEVSEAVGRRDQDLSEPWYGLYYDNRAEVVEFDGLKAGDVLEVQYTVADTAGRNELSDYFGDFQFVAETLPIERWDYTLIGPRARSFYFHEPALPGFAKAVSETAQTRTTRFSARDVPRIDPEPSMPGFAEVAPYLHVSTYRTWDDVGHWYWRLVQDQLVPDDAVRKAAREAVAHARTELEKVRAVHALVMRGTRYVGLEFGIHGYKPYRVGQVLSRRFGDCKDKASLIFALLREVGIEAQLVLLRTRRGGRVAPEPASLAVFDHAIAYVPSLNLYLDGTAEFSGMIELPDQDQGVMVLRVGPKGSLLTETPVLPSRANRAERLWKVALGADGDGTIDETLTITGQAAPDWRRHYESAGERQERYAKVWNGRFPGANLASLDMQGIDDRNQPVVARATVAIPRLATPREGGERELPVSARDSEFVRAYAKLSRRTYDLLLGFPWQHEETLIYDLPAGTPIVRLPQPREETSPFGRFALRIKRDGDRRIQVSTSVDVTSHRIAPADYQAFRRFLGVVDAAMGERIVIGGTP